MAKMFYNLEETAAKLGLSEAEVKDLVEQGKLQQFRERDKLMFKREQVDDLADEPQVISLDDTEDSGELSLDDTATSLSSKTDAIELVSDSDGSSPGGSTSGFALELDDGEARDQAKSSDDTGGPGVTSEVLAAGDEDESQGISLQDTGSGELTLDDSAADSKPLSLDDTGSASEEIALVDPSASEEMQLDDSVAGSGHITLDDSEAESAGVDLSDTSDDSSVVILDDTGMSSANLDIDDAPAKPTRPTTPKGKGASTAGVSVFDTGEVEVVDPMERTQVSRAFDDGGPSGATDVGEEELALDSVGSGSGLLDLTRESDDTSLGAVELLDDSNAGSEVDEGALATGGTLAGSVAGSNTGVFASASASAKAAATGEADAEAEGEEEASDFEEGSEIDAAPVMAGAYAAEGYDPVGDSFGGALLLGVFATLAVALAIAMTGFAGQITPLTRKFIDGADPTQTLYMFLGGLLGIHVVLFLIGFFVGKSRAKK